jgi:hypothetical protein
MLCQGSDVHGRETVQVIVVMIPDAPGMLAERTHQFQHVSHAAELPLGTTHADL